MSQFPNLRPSSRSFVPGMLPVNTFASVSGKETRVILGDTSHNHTASLSFSNLQEPVVKQIWTIGITGLAQALASRCQARFGLGGLITVQR